MLEGTIRTYGTTHAQCTVKADRDTLISVARAMSANDHVMVQFVENARSITVHFHNGVCYSAAVTSWTGREGNDDMLDVILGYHAADMAETDAFAEEIPADLRVTHTKY